MKLLFDENLAESVAARLQDLFPGSIHVEAADLVHTPDHQIWSYAREYGYAIISKDSDFHQLSLLFGHPPKFIFLRVGNCPSRGILELLRSEYSLISSFLADGE